MQAAEGKTGVLFVCLGNINRSPAAEAVFRDLVQKQGCADEFVIDSCGTGGGSKNWYQPGGFTYHRGVPKFPHAALAVKPCLLIQECGAAASGRVVPTACSGSRQRQHCTRSCAPQRLCV